LDSISKYGVLNGDLLDSASAVAFLRQERLLARTRRFRVMGLCLGRRVNRIFPKCEASA
jgi:hypothetical protein